MPPEDNAPTSRWLTHPLFRWSAGILAAVATGLLAFQAFGFPVLGRTGMPHEICYVRDPRLIGLHATADLLIGLEYASVLGTLGFLVCVVISVWPFTAQL